MLFPAFVSIVPLLLAVAGQEEEQRATHDSRSNFPPAVAHSLNEAMEEEEEEMSQSVLFLDSSQGSGLSLLFLYSRGCIRSHYSRRYAGYD
jgi:hypothetical protein